MYDTLRTQFYWLNMTMQVFQTARDCRDCAQSRGTRYRHQKEMTLFRASTPLDYIAIDLLGPLIKSENGCTDILVITDRFSKLARVVPLQSTKAPVVANALLEHWILPYGLPKHVLSDNGPQFVGKVFTTIRTMLSLKHDKTLAYHPQTNGQTERYNQTLVHRLRVFVSEHQRDWDTLIQPLTYAYNAQVHRTTGQKPFSLALTRTPGNPALYVDNDCPDTAPTTAEEQKTNVFERTRQLIKLAAERTEAQQARYKNNFDRRVRTSMKVNPGEEVFIDNPPSAGKPMSERTADETITKLTRKAGTAHKVLKVDKTSVTVDRDGV